MRQEADWGLKRHHPTAQTPIGLQGPDSEQNENSWVRSATEALVLALRHLHHQAVEFVADLDLA